MAIKYKPKSLKKKQYRKKRKMNITANKMGIHYFRRCRIENGYTFTTDANGHSQFQRIQLVLGNLIDNSDFVNLFDQYKILGGEVQFNWSPNSIDPTSTTQYPCLWSLVDKDTATNIPFSLGLTFQNVKYNQLSAASPFKTFNVPAYVQNEISETGGVTTARNPIKSPWIDTNQNGVAHGSVFVALTGSPNTTYRLQRRETYHLMMKCPK